MIEVLIDTEVNYQNHKMEVKIVGKFEPIPIQTCNSARYGYFEAYCEFMNLKKIKTSRGHELYGRRGIAKF